MTSLKGVIPYARLPHIAPSVRRSQDPITEAGFHVSSTRVPIYPANVNLGTLTPTTMS